MSDFIQDLRFTLRQQWRAPGFTLLVVLTLALGIGFATAVFSVIDAVLLKSLPFAHQERLVIPDTHARSGYNQPWSWPSYIDARPQLKPVALTRFGLVVGSVNIQQVATSRLPQAGVRVEAFIGTR